MSSSLHVTFGDELRESLQARAATFIWIASFLVGAVLAASDQESIGDLGLLLFVLSAGGWGLCRRWPRLRSWVFPLVQFGLVLLALSWLDVPALASLLAIPTGSAALFLGTPHGLGMALASTVLLIFGDGLLPLPDIPSRAIALLVVWATYGFVWVAITYASRAVAAALESYERMRSMLGTARDQRLVLRETQEDLEHANLELARVAERLRSMREVAEQARRAKEEFIANVSHELRTPLNMIIGFSEMVVQAPQIYGFELPPRLLADIAVIQRNSQHLAALVNDVLDLSQADASRMALSREWVDLRETVEAAVEAVQPLFESKDLELLWDVPQDLPGVYCDRTRIRQVVLNLLSNAGRFTDRGEVRVCARQEDERVIVSVADTGPGIPQEDQQRIFEPFEQLGGATRARYGGSGLGLTISRRFVEMHGGTMWLESESGRGTTFSFALPIAGLVATPDHASSLRRWFRPDDYYEARTRPVRAATPAIVPRLVVVESDEGLKRLFGRASEELEIVSTRDLDGALREVSRVPAQALIVNDPQYEQILAQRERLAGLPYGTPVIGCWCRDEQVAAETLGLVRYLVKPIRREELLAALDDLQPPIRSILLADDEPEAIQLFGRMLSSAGKGYRIIRATTGKRALSLLRRHRPDVLLLDLIMPDMDGYEVLHEKSLDAAIRDIPTIAISAQDPAHGPLTTGLSATKNGGVYAEELLRSILALSQVLPEAKRVYEDIVQAYGTKAQMWKQSANGNGQANGNGRGARHGEPKDKPAGADPGALVPGAQDAHGLPRGMLRRLLVLPDASSGWQLVPLHVRHVHGEPANGDVPA